MATWGAGATLKLMWGSAFSSTPKFGVYSPPYDCTRTHAHTHTANARMVTQTLAHHPQQENGNSGTHTPRGDTSPVMMRGALRSSGKTPRNCETTPCTCQGRVCMCFELRIAVE